MSEKTTLTYTKSPKTPKWLGVIWVALWLLTIGFGSYLVLVFVVKPYMVDKTALALNRFVVYGDEVTIEDAEFLTFSPPKIKFQKIRARGKDSEGIEQDAIRIETGIVTFDWGNITRIFTLFPDFRLDTYQANIQAIELENCQLNFEIISDSLSNFILFRPDAANLRRPDNRPNRILIDRLILRNTDFRVRSQIPDQMGLDFSTRVFDFSLDSVDLELDIKKEDIYFQIKGLSGLTNYVAFDTVRILSHTPIQMDGDFILYKMDRNRRANGETGTNVSLDNLTFSAENLSLALGGFYRVENQKKVYSLQLKSSIKKTRTTLENFLKILPKSNADLIRKYDVRGDLQLDVSFQKKDPAATDPHIEIDFESHNASFFPRLGVFKGEQRVSDLFLSGRFSNGSRNHFETSFIEIDSIRARLGAPIDFTGSIRFDSIYDPQKIHLTTVFNIDTANLADVLSMVDSIPHFESGGQVQLVLSLEGLVRDLNLRDIDKVKYNGLINLYDLHFYSQINQMPVRLDKLNGALDLISNHIQINPSNPLTGTLNSHEVNVSGIIYDIAQYIVRRKKNLNPVWKSSFHIRLDNLGVGELADSVGAWLIERRKLMGFDPTDLSQKEGLSIYYNIGSLTDDMDLDLVVESENLDLSRTMNDKYPESLQFDFFRVVLQLRNGALLVPEMTLYNSQDTIRLSFSWQDLESERMHLTSSIHFQTKDLVRFLSQFGQTVELGKVHNEIISATGILALDGLAIAREGGDSLALSLKLVDLDLEGKDLDLSLTNLTLHTKLNQNHLLGREKDALLMDSVYLLIDGNELSGQATINDWEKKVFELMVNTTALPLATIHKYVHAITEPKSELELALERLDHLEGSLKFKTHLRGTLDTLDVMKSLLYASQQGEIHFNNIGFEYKWINQDKPLKFENIDGSFRFDPAGISFDRFKGYFGHSNFLLTGSGQDILPFIFDNQPLRATVDIESDFLDLTDVVSNLSGGDPVVESPDSASHYRGRSLMDILSLADFKAHAKVDKAFFVRENNTIQVDNLILEGTVKERMLTIDPIQLRYSTGELKGDIVADVSDTANIGFTSNFQIMGFPLEGIYPLLRTGGIEPDGIQLAGHFWVNGWMQDTLRNQNQWSLSDNTAAKLNNIKVADFSITNLNNDPRIRWEGLLCSTRFGIKTVLGLNRYSWLTPEPRGILVDDSLNISDGIISFHDLEIQSNKASIMVKGDYALHGPGTYINTYILKAGKQEKKDGRPEYNNVLPTDYTRSQFRPYLNYKLYSEKEKKVIADEIGIKISEVDDGYYKFHSNLGYTLGTLPRRLRYIFSKNPNKERNRSD